MFVCVRVFVGDDFVRACRCVLCNICASTNNARRAAGAEAFLRAFLSECVCEGASECTFVCDTCASANNARRAAGADDSLCVFVHM